MLANRINVFLVLLLLLTLVNCKRTEQPQTLVVDQLAVYNDVLNELVKNRFYYYYLGEDEVNELCRKYDCNGNRFDSVGFYNQLSKLKEEIEVDTAKQRSILLTHRFMVGYERAAKYMISDSSYFDDLRSSLLLVSSDLKQISDSLNSPQQRFHAKDFHSNAFRVSTQNREIGVVSFSKLLFDKTSTQAILYYEFVCGSKCGFGEILILHRIGENWVIKQPHQLWIS